MSHFSPILASTWEKNNARRLRWLAFALVVVGLTWRFSCYLLRFPIWGDEAMLLVNYFHRGYLDLLGPIDNCQVAPILFHWMEYTVVHWLGTGELVVRLPPFLACLGSLALFWRLAHLTLPPLARTMAVGILSVSIWPATLGALVKPYAGDLFFALALLVPAVSWLRTPGRLRWLAVLAVVVPVAMLASYPVVFVSGAVSLALLPAVWHGRDRKTITLFVLYNLLLVGTFAAHYLVVGRNHLASPVHGGTTDGEMHSYWALGFPPSQSLAFGRWFLLAHTGQMAAYPLGSASGGSIVTVLLALVGVWQLRHHAQRRLLALIGGTFALGFIAALAHKYPYGASCRLAQYLAPFWCLLAGSGVATLIQRCGNERAHERATLAVFGVLVLIGMGGMMRDFLRHGREDGLWARQVTMELLARARHDLILVAQEPGEVYPVFQWQLGRLGEQVSWQPNVDWLRAAREHVSLWIFSCGGPFADEELLLRRQLEGSGQRWRCTERKESLVMRRRTNEGIEHCRVYHWVREP